MWNIHAGDAGSLNLNILANKIPIYVDLVVHYSRCNTQTAKPSYRDNEDSKDDLRQRALLRMSSLGGL